MAEHRNSKESRIVYDRFEDICPRRKIAEMSDEELFHDCGIAFKIIGYEPRNMDNAFESAKAVSDWKGWLFEFIYNVWLGDVNGS